MKIKNWDKFQRFKHKSDMKWFKCYGRDLLNDPDFMKMDDVKQATLFKLWCLASESNGVLPNAYDIAFRLRKPIAFVEKILIELDTWFGKNENIDKLYTNYITDNLGGEHAGAAELGPPRVLPLAAPLGLAEQFLHARLETPTFALGRREARAESLDVLERRRFLGLRRKVGWSFDRDRKRTGILRQSPPGTSDRVLLRVEEPLDAGG